MQDLISRQAAIDALWKALYEYEDKTEKQFQESEDLDVGDWIEHRIFVQNMNDIDRQTILNLPSAQPEQRWIPVSERLPEPRVDVWVNSDIGQIQGYYEEHVGVWYASFGQGRDYLELIVNAWMPLPEPYGEEGGANGNGKRRE